jgi:hypothetical protein
MNALMMAYACETVGIRHAEAFIAEREYNRSLIRAKSVKLFMSQRRNTFEHDFGALKELSDAKAAHPRREQRDMTRQRHRPAPLYSPGFGMHSTEGGFAGHPVSKN